MPRITLAQEGEEQVPRKVSHCQACLTFRSTSADAKAPGKQVSHGLIFSHHPGKRRSRRADAADDGLWWVQHNQGKSPLSLTHPAGQKGRGRRCRRGQRQEAQAIPPIHEPAGWLQQAPGRQIATPSNLKRVAEIKTGSLCSTTLTMSLNTRKTTCVGDSFLWFRSRVLFTPRIKRHASRPAQLVFRALRNRPGTAFSS